MSTLEERFWAKVDVGNPDECWTWTAGLRGKGYGSFKVGRTDKYAHRVSYELNVGPIPDGLQVRHSCDNPPCVNPSHLSVGTHADNMNDKVLRDRQHRLRGRANGRARLTESQVCEIRELCSRGASQQFVADTYGISQSLVSLIKLRQAWGHVD